ncbi:hypothetical protein BH09PAT2_BH09PAT2_03680 [soil metagenome]
MHVPKEFTTVTPLSKNVALFLFIALPFFSFFLGYSYRESLMQSKSVATSQQIIPTLIATISFAKNQKLEVVAKKNAHDSTKKDIYLKDPSTGKQEIYMTLKNIKDIYNFGEYHNGNLYIVKRVGNDKYPSDAWTDELWKYDSQKQGKKLYALKGLDFRVSSDERYIAIVTNDELGIFDSNGRWLKTILAKDLKFPDKLGLPEESAMTSLNFMGVTPTEIWLNNRFGPSLIGLIKVNFDTYDITRYDLANLSGIHEFDFNPTKMRMIYSNYPTIFDIETDERYKKTKSTVNLMLYDLQTKEQKEIATSITKMFMPSWIDEHTIEYDDPNGVGRIQKIIQ